MKKPILLFLLIPSVVFCVDTPTPKSTPVPTSSIVGAPIIVYLPYNKMEDVLFPPQVIDDKGQVYYRFLAVPKK